MRLSLAYSLAGYMGHGPLAAIASVLLVFSACAPDPAEIVPPIDSESTWRQYAVPDEAGWSSQALEDARLHAESLESGAVMVVHRGHVVAAWGDVERKFRCHSVRKMFLSSLFDRPVSQGQINLNATLGDLGINDIDALTPTELTATVTHMLTSSSGVYHLAAKESPEVDASRPARGSHPPGTFFWYNNWNFNTLVTIFGQARPRAPLPRR